MMQFNDEKEFIQKMLIEEIRALQNQGFHYVSFLLMGQAIELLGSFLDDKPMRAKGQSERRFARALYGLFPPIYGKVNADNRLYKKLRNDLVHLMLPGNYLLLYPDATNSPAKHLTESNGALVLIATEFRQDLEAACFKLFRLMDQGKIKSKRLASSLKEGEK